MKFFLLLSVATDYILICLYTKVLCVGSKYKKVQQNISF